jgi:hypothetical protein
LVFRACCPTLFQGFVWFVSASPGSPDLKITHRYNVYSKFKISEKENCNEEYLDDSRIDDGAASRGRGIDDSGRQLLRSSDVLQWRLPLPVLPEVAARGGASPLLKFFTVDVGQRHALP